MTQSPATQPSLLVRIRDAADTVAWSTFIEIYTPVIYAFLKRRGLQNADAADIAQEVFRAVYRSIGDYEYRGSDGSFRGWLLTVTRNKMLDHASRQQRQAAVSGGTENLLALGEQPVSSEEEIIVEREYRARLFETACQTVKHEFRDQTWTAFWETQMEQRPNSVVAEELGISVDSVYVARSRIIARLRQRVEELDSVL